MPDLPMPVRIPIRILKMHMPQSRPGGTDEIVHRRAPVETWA